MRSQATRYVVRPRGAGAALLRIDGDGSEHDVPERSDLVAHEDQLLAAALAVLVDFLGEGHEATAIEHHRAFRTDVLLPRTREGQEIDGLGIVEWLDLQEGA